MNAEAPVDKHGFTIKPPMTDKEVIVKCLQNVPCGVCHKQAQRIIQEMQP